MLGPLPLPRRLARTTNPHRRSGRGTRRHPQAGAGRSAAPDQTEIYNWRERIAAGEQLQGNDLDRATAARAFIVHRLHEQIDAAVADAYGWPADLAPAEIVARLVALNAERKAEEEAGTIRWLRPDYQTARFGNK